MSACERCNGSGFEDSGGVQPWGEPILVECECRLMERNMDESRKAFEQWALEVMQFTTDDLTWDEKRNCYRDYVPNMAWKGWQDGRKAIEIVIPATCADDEYFNDGVFQPMRYERDVERAIRAAGIKVKE